MRFRPCLFILIFFSVMLAACSSESGRTPAQDKAQELIDKAIAVHGGEKFENLDLSFTFRDKTYAAVRRQGQFTYSRSFSDSTGTIKDVLTNTGFTRTVNGIKQDIPAAKQKAYAASVNSVIYFALLPFGLNDPAVRKEYLGAVTIKNQPYHKIKVTFTSEGGGEHYTDEFLYWLHQETNTMDYFSYKEGGVRFRQAQNARVVNGIRFQDYINYKTRDSLDYLNLDKQFEAGTLDELSRIELKNIQVK